MTEYLQLLKFKYGIVFVYVKIWLKCDFTTKFTDFISYTKKIIGNFVI